MKLTSTLVIPVAGLLVALGAGAVLAANGVPSAGAAAPIVPAAASPSPAPSAGTVEPRLKDPLLTDVLDGLVTKGTITEAQKTAILDALAAERTARATELRQRAQQLRDFLSDGQITQDELDQLPADSPLRTLTSLMDDGKITVDELRSIGRGMLRGLGGFGKPGRAFGRDLGPFGPKVLPDASPSPSAGTSG